MLLLGFRFSEKSRQVGDTVDVVRGINPGDLAGSGEKIPESGRVIGLRAGRDRSGPAGHHRHSDSPFVHRTLVALERAVGVEKLVLVLTFLVGPVVGGEEHEGVLVDPEFLEQRKKPTHVRIHPGNHRGEPLLRVGPVLVGVDPVTGNLHPIPEHASSLVVGVRNRPVNVEEKGILPVSAHEIECSIGHHIVSVGDPLLGDATSGCRVVLHQHIPLECDLLLILPEERRIEVVGRALVEKAEPVIETVVVRVPGIVDLGGIIDVPERPFPDPAGGVARFLQEFGHGALRAAEAIASIADQPSGPHVLAGPEHEPGWTADGVTGVVIGEPHSLGRHAVEVWGLHHFLPVASEIPVSEIVSHDVDEVGRPIG